MTLAVEQTGGHFMEMLAPAERAALVGGGRVREFAHDQALMHQAQVADRVFVLLAGYVKVYSTTANGREAMLAIRDPGDLIGELSAIDDRPRSASIVALQPVEALVLPSGEFRRFLTAHPHAALVLLRVLSERLREADVQRTEYTAHQTLGRVAARIVELVKRFGHDDGGVIELGVSLTQEEMAGWTGASIESVGRAYREMRKLGWIETRPLKVLDLDAIRSAAE